MTAWCTKPVLPCQLVSGSESTGMKRNFGFCPAHFCGRSRRYRSFSRRAPQYRTISRGSFFLIASSRMDLIGAKPVPLATNTAGLALFAQPEIARRDLDAHNASGRKTGQDFLREPAAGQHAHM